VKGQLDGSITRLQGLTDKSGPVLYSKPSMEQLVDNDSKRCNSTEYVINECRMQQMETIYKLTPKYRFKKFQRNLVEE
jgi:hypothetical protein